ncbi:TetR/AcrR family transcriptional regulator (plasmid) [Streptomyces sp. NBC_00335]|uniref:ScbR family autoregulator-binding transcription factor n=1 Tax=unclassified Streptomyces TaxID=2593676 RepID=UPI002259C6A3|nr:MULTISPECIES: ScbR family autoregulator-binding transcription factor [unclassified Streptomyces]MCX5410009.1 ScbR family autoregulator-binding transcription factor [Streptomyces sp. NBC_00086]
MARQERAIRTRQKILVAAAELFDEVGYEAATISEVLKRSGVTKGALYFHFTSKEELAQAVLAGQVGALPPVPEPDLFLQQSLDEALVLAHLLYKGDPLVRGSVRLTVDQGSVIDGLDRRIPMQGWNDHNAAVLARAKECGELLPHIDIESTAKMFTGSFTGVQVLSKIMTGHADMVERVTDLMRTLLTAIAMPGVLVRLDFAPDRAERVYEAAVKERDAKAEAQAAQAAAEAAGA